jgi:hypothetical protein
MDAENFKIFKYITWNENIGKTEYVDFIDKEYPYFISRDGTDWKVHIFDNRLDIIAEHHLSMVSSYSNRQIDNIVENGFFIVKTGRELSVLIEKFNQVLKNDFVSLNTQYSNDDNNRIRTKKETWNFDFFQVPSRGFNS